MDPSSFSELAPVLAEPIGIGALGAMALWLGARVVHAAIESFERVALARLTARETLAQAVSNQAQALTGLAAEQGELRRASEAQVVALRLIAGRMGMGWHSNDDDEPARDGVSGDAQ